MGVSAGPKGLLLQLLRRYYRQTLSSSSFLFKNKSELILLLVTQRQSSVVPRPSHPSTNRAEASHILHAPPELAGRELNLLTSGPATLSGFMPAASPGSHARIYYTPFALVMLGF